MNSQKGIAPIAIILIIIGVLILGGGYYYAVKEFQKPAVQVCTQDAKQCPDGLYVSRTGPNCEFAACPEITKDWKTYRNEEYGFEMQYPSNWYADVLEDDGVEFSPIPLEERHDFTSEKKTVVRIIVSYFIPLDPDSSYSQIEKMTLDGRPAIKKISETKYRIGSAKSIAIYQEGYLEEENKQLNIDFFIYAHLQDWETIQKIESVYSPVFNQILSTFKFIP